MVSAYLALCASLLLLPVGLPRQWNAPPRSDGGVIEGQARGAPRGQTDRSAAQAPPSGETEDGAERVFVTSRDDYRIAPSDVIEIKIEDAPELSGRFTVSAAGTVLVPVLGSIGAQDRTPEELSKLIANGLRQAEYLNSPRVAVAVSQYNSRSFFIQGAIRYPGVYVIKGRPSLLKLITMAGGLSDNHGGDAFIIREVVTAGSENDWEQYRMTRVALSAVLSGQSDQNAAIQPGDIINIPPANVFYVAGEVVAAGSYPLKEGTTLRQAISLARGLTFKAAASRGVIFRDDPKTGRRTEVKVDIGAIMSGKREDIDIQANDIIIVPNSRMRSISSALMSAFGVGAASRGMVIR